MRFHVETQFPRGICENGCCAHLQHHLCRKPRGHVGAGVSPGSLLCSAGSLVLVPAARCLNYCGSVFSHSERKSPHACSSNAVGLLLVQIIPV